MGAYPQQPWDEKVPGVDLSMGIPRRRGLLSALLGVQNDSAQLPQAGIPEDAARHASPQYPQDPGMSAQNPRLKDRVQDDTTYRTPTGQSATQRGGDDHLAQMQAEYDRLGQPPVQPKLSLKDRI